MFDAWIYKIVCKDECISECYVGSTTVVRKRRRTHKSNCCNINSRAHNLKVYKFIRDHGGWENWDLVVIEQIECESKADKLLAERTAMEAIDATLNAQVPGRSVKEWSAEYYAENKDKILKREAAYYVANKDKIRKRMAGYCAANKDKIKNRSAERVRCECGSTHRRSDKARHLKSAKHARLIAQI